MKITTMSFVQIFYDGEQSSSSPLEPNNSNNIETNSNEDNIHFNPITDSEIMPENEEISPKKNENIHDNCTLGWSEKETKYLLKKYNAYILRTGYCKKFKTKRELWNRVAEDMKNDLKVYKSGFQCENRYKTVLRKWRKRRQKIRDNVGSANVSKPIEQDPVSSENITERVVSNSDKNNDEKSIQEVLWKIFKQQEENRERRHQEKMKLLKSIFINHL